MSDPNYDNGNGERIMIASTGALRDVVPSDLDLEFWKSDYVIFGGTALSP